MSQPKGGDRRARDAAGAGPQGFQGYGLSILRIGYLVPRMIVVLLLVVERFFESRDV